ncbi:hypothetical protein TB1_026527 [Malus domestica]|uniref:uncharacterized protein isoform X1 n=1 Tax=Malus domestica TaxID=3750 RepID=UPI0010AACB59|nr:uncharacterized protein LOC103401750 [Malus domestica]
MSTDDVDAAELLLRLSIFGFSQLSASDQLQETEEVRNKLVHQGVPVLEQLPEETEEDLRVRTFTELFKKLPFSEHDIFLSKVVKKFKREGQCGELVSWFSTQLDFKEQQEVIGKIVHVTADYDETSDEDAILGRFSQLSRDYTDYGHKLLVPCMEEHKKKRKDKQRTAKEETSSDWQFRFDEFFFGFSIVWFKGQSVSSQDKEQDFRLRKFSELLHTKALPFGIQVYLIDMVVEELRESHHWTRLVRDIDGILSYLLTFGFSLRSPIDQQRKIEEISSEAGGKFEIIKRLVEESEGDFRMRTFASQVHKVGLRTRAAILFEVSNKFFCERKLHDLTLLFRQLGSNGRKNLIEQLFDWLMETYYSSKYTKDVIIEKLSEESEEDFRVRRFIKLCTTHPSLWDQNEVAKWDLTSMLQTSGNREINKAKHDGISVSHNYFSSRYAEFYFGLSVIWFKTNKSGIHSIEVLLGEAEEGDTIEKLCGENEEDFRLRRFIESFNQLQVSSQEYIVKYILRSLEQNIYKEGGLLTAWLTYNDVFPTWFEDLPSALGLLKGKLVTEGVAEGPGGRAYSFEEDLPSALEFIKVKIPNLRGGTRRRGRGSRSRRRRRRSNRNYRNKSTDGSMICNNAQVISEQNYHI